MSAKIGLLIAVILLAAVSFSIGSEISTRTRLSVPDPDTPAKFSPVRAVQPQLAFYSLSFCPYQKQLISTLAPLSRHLAGRLILAPHYLFIKITDLPQYCRLNHGDPDRCPEYTGRGFYPSLDTCKKDISAKNSRCLSEKVYLRSPGGIFYTSLNGRQEAAENIREICAFRQADSGHVNWWRYLSLVSQNCTPDTVDYCWRDQAEAAGLDASAITECFNREAFTIIESELAAASANQIVSTPSLLINEIPYSPEKRKLQVGNEIFEAADLRTPNILKKIICASYPSPPDSCDVPLPPAEFPLGDQFCAIPQ